MATRTISASGGTRNYDDTASWDEGVVPISADDIVARGDGTSGNLTINVASVCRSANFTNYTGTLTMSANWVIGTTTLVAGGDTLKMVAGMGFVRTAGTITFSGGVAGQKITWAGKQPSSVTLGASGGAWTFLDDLTMVTAGAFTFTRGTLDLTGRTLTVGRFLANGALTRTLTLTNATINIISTTATDTVFDVSGTGMTLAATGSVINITVAVSSGARTIATGGLSIGAVRYTASGVSGLTITGGGTLAELRSTGAARTLTLPAGATVTVGSVPQIANGATIVSSTPGTAATLSVASGTMQVEGAIIQDVHATGGATFTAINSKNVSGNTGWTFERRARGWGIAA